MKHDILIATIITLISYGLLFVYCMARNLYREHVSLAKKVSQLKAELEYVRTRPLWEGYESEEVWRKSIDHQNRFIEAGRFVEGLFNPLQIEAFRLVKDLRAFLNDIGPRPSMGEGECKDAEELEQWYIKKISIEEPWLQKLKAGYVLKFRTRVEGFYYRSVENGHKSDTLASLTYPASSSEQIESIVVELWKLAFLLQDADSKGV